MAQASPGLTTNGAKLTPIPTWKWLFVPAKALQDVALPQMCPVSPQECFTCTPRLMFTHVLTTNLLDKLPRHSLHYCSGGFHGCVAFWPFYGVPHFTAAQQACQGGPSEQKGEGCLCASESGGILLKFRFWSSW